MSEFKIQMPKLGESVQEATITKWFVKEGDQIKEDDPLFEVATDKVDSEIPSPVDGTIKKIFFAENSLVPVGEIVATVILEGEEDDSIENESDQAITEPIKTGTPQVQPAGSTEVLPQKPAQSGRFYSPLVLSIAKTEQVSWDELEQISGSGLNGRVQKQDILQYIDQRKAGVKTSTAAVSTNAVTPVENPAQTAPKVSASIGSDDQIIEMDRVRKLIAEHMVRSKQVAPHVTSVVEADVTNLVMWRNKVKDQFLQKYGEKITFMPVFTEAVARALAEFPLVNSSVDGTNIIMHKHINIGIAVAKPDGNLVVPVVKNAEQKNLLGLTKNLNSLADRARTNKLSPEDYQGGTFTITNFGSFRNIIGTPIINQPQVAILATGSIEKKPAVIETPYGDAIVVRHKMFLSLSYDHRIIDGALGGAFLRRIADILEEFSMDREV